MGFDIKTYVLGFLIVAYPIFVIVGIKALRRRSEAAEANGERRQRPGLRKALNILAPIPFLALIAYTLWDAGIITDFDPGFSPAFYYTAAGIIAYMLVLMGIIHIIRYVGRKKTYALGENRRGQQPKLRFFLNVLATLPVVFILYMLARHLLS